MELQKLSNYTDTLYHCRFCPMCKPVADVANVTQIESHSTRGKALLLWMTATGKSEFTPRSAELLYQSTLDSVSESWCVNHFPVSDYNLSARMEVFRKGMLPDTVEEALETEKEPKECPKAKSILLAAESKEISGAGRIEKARKLLSSIGKETAVYSETIGVLSFFLGDIDKARSQAEKIAGSLKQAGVEEVIADGPQTLFALKKMYPLLGVKLPEGMKVQSLTEVLYNEYSNTGKGASGNGKKVFVHDARCTFYLGDTMATDQAFQPHFTDDENALGTGAVYEMPRKLLDSLGMERLLGVWSRSLAKSSGADDALWITYPKLARMLAEQRINYAVSLGAEAIVTDSLLSAEYLDMTSREMDEGIEVIWLPEMFE